MPRRSKTRKTKIRLALFGFVIVGTILAASHWVAQTRSPEDQAKRYYEHGVKFADENDNVKAGIEFRNALRLDKNLLPAWRRLAEIEEAGQQWGDLIRSLQSILSLSPNDLEVRVKLVKLLSLSGRVYQALELTDTGNEADDQNARIVGLRSAILYKLDNKERAIQEAKRTLTIDSRNADALIVLASDKMAKGDLKDASEILGSAVVDQNADIGIQLLKLRIFEQLGDMSNYESLLVALVRARPDEISFQRQLVKFYVDRGRDTDAENELRSSAKANRENVDAELALVRFILAKRGAEAAKEELIARIAAGGRTFPFQMALVDFDISQEKYDAAETTLRDLSKNSSDQDALTARVKLAELEFKRNRIDVAEAIVNEVLRNDAHNASALSVRAASRITRGQLDLAIADLQQAIESQPRSTELMLLLALAFERSGSIGRAEKQYAEAVRISNYDPTVGLQYVNFLLRRGSIDRAEQFLTELSKRTPNNVQVLSALAKIDLKRQDWASAQAVAGELRNTPVGGGVADQILGAALVGQKKYDESIALFEKAVEAAPRAVQPMVSLVQALVRAQKSDKAEAFLRSTLADRPDSAEALVLLGAVKLSTGDRDQAAKQFEAAIEKQPKNIVGYQALLNLYIGERKFDEALSVIRSGLQSLPGDLVLQLAMADTFERTGQYEDAILTYESILKTQPGSTVAVNNLASLLSEHRDDKASLDKAHALAASLRDTPIPQFKDTLGWVSYRREDYATAVALLEKAAAALPNLAVVRYHLGMSYLAIRQNMKASEQLNAALSLGPDPKLEGRIRNALKEIVAD